jgi:hypothetical protein
VSLWGGLLGCVLVGGDVWCLFLDNQQVCCFPGLLLVFKTYCYNPGGLGLGGGYHYGFYYLVVD